KDFFFITNDLYNKYIANKSRYYLTNLDLVTEIILHNINDLKLIRPIILNDLFEDPQMEILIRAMFDCDLNVTKTASNIYMHRNTVIKRLELIKNTTGLNIQKFNDANIMYWLIKKK
ncbi:MAG TPA: PucR family transcriptional regulator, partial [Acholeplasmataceae bacterium]|nr:PucR family transcriptional regulator [Acholeplasmataceae bacterium]